MSSSTPCTHMCFSMHSICPSIHANKGSLWTLACLPSTLWGPVASTQEPQHVCLMCLWWACAFTVHVCKAAAHTLLAHFPVCLNSRGLALHTFVLRPWLTLWRSLVVSLPCPASPGLWWCRPVQFPGCCTPQLTAHFHTLILHLFFSCLLLLGRFALPDSWGLPKAHHTLPLAATGRAFSQLNLARWKCLLCGPLHPSCPWGPSLLACLGSNPGWDCTRLRPDSYTTVFTCLPVTFHSFWSYFSTYWASTDLGSSSFSVLSFLPFHTAHGVLKARILKWFAIPFSSGDNNDNIKTIIITVKRTRWVSILMTEGKHH